ncbi:alpha/beta hydrolase [Schumannella luteola]|uniref:Pimeloyl-ACP methyl ester carboxylesterase n=1 Tax=Schumannella luteola TaxID=472059 RepID=A0A852Y9V4_9MICO|nr:alpha/beta hydrolase [Schumannella luteola]NYG98642.1 pimeloyl-ACP methyl ester carboxylesterase [Schumannella luteola]TPX02610.1 alpha/beta hydrolase [Schumannella luteola]
MSRASAHPDDPAVSVRDRRAVSGRRRGLAVVALAAALAVGLSGCVQWFMPPQGSRTSTPSDEKVDAALKPYYQQKLSWKGCSDGMQCATAKAPLDWADPGGESIDLALIRQPATSGNAKGSLLINPGGPGGSGYDFVRDSVDYATSKKLQASYDIVGFDPRGVGHSSAVSCYTDPKAFDEYIYGITPGTPGSDEWLAAAEKSNQQFGQDCLKGTGELLGHVDTVSAARDLDMLRAALGDKKLNYLGYSYGTFLGATYADLFPKKTGHLVLDGALDPATSDFDVTLTQAKGFESAFRAYLKDCLTRKGCPFASSVDDSVAEVEQLFGSVQQSPILDSDGRELGTSALFTAIIYPLYSKESWPYLDQLFSDVFSGSAQVAFQLADAYYSRDDKGDYADNSTEAFISINCLDYKNDDSDPATMRQQAVQLADEAPLFGPQMAFGGAGCVGWPFQGTRDRVAISADGSAPIIVVGTTNDPATPYVWAQAMAKQLQNGHLVTYNGEGHTAYNKSNSCVNNAVDGFFLDDKVPTKDPDC